MYTDEQIEQFFGKHIKNKNYFGTYVAIYKYFMENETDSNRFNHHHFVPCNITKESLQEKNRYHTIEKHDKLFDIKDNVVKLPIKWHVIAHYCLAMATLREDDINSFFTLVGDYSKPIQNYTFDDVQNLAQLVEENAQSNSIDHYITLSERKELYKQTAKDNKEKYIEEHKEEIEQKKEEFKQKQKENRELWKKEHADEIEERKRKQREYAKKMREEFKKNAKRNK